MSGAREANLQLLRELESMADMLGSANEQHLALKNRVALLEQTLARAHQDAALERAYILEQQDAFIAAMMEDHEQVLVELHRELDAARTRQGSRIQTLPDFPGVKEPPTERDVQSELDAAERTIEKLFAERDRARETLLKLQAQRDEAQATVARRTRERDQARAEQTQSRITDAVRQALPPSTTPLPALRSAPTLPPPESPRRSPPPPAVTDSRSTGPVAVGSITRPRAPALELTPREPPTHPSPPPEELAAALHPPSSGQRVPTSPGVAPAGVRASSPGSSPTASLGSSPRAASGEEARINTPPGPSVITAPPPGTSPSKAVTAPPPVAAQTVTAQAGVTAPPPVTPSKEPGSRSGGGYSLTNSVAPEHVPTSHVSRAPRR